MVLNMFRGFCMACADSVPGISGGTIAYILGFYELFVKSLANLFSRNKEKRREAMPFLILLGGGWVIGMGICVTVLSSLFETHIYFMSSLFMGLTIFSLPMIIRGEKIHFENTLKQWIETGVLMIVGVLAVVLLTNASPTGTMDFDNLDISIYLFVFFAGMMSISAMVLPGISGSSILLIFGLYIPIITSLKALMGLDLSVLPILVVFGLGILTGMVSVVKLVKYCLDHFRTKTMSLIFGLVIGALYAIVMGPTTLDVPQAAMQISSFSILGFIVGILPILIIEGLNYKKKVNLEEQ